MALVAGGRGSGFQKGVIIKGIPIDTLAAYVQ